MEFTSPIKTFVQRSSDWVDIAHKLAVATKARKEAERMESIWASMLKTLSEGQSSQGGQFKYELIKRKGSISYKDIPMLKDLDLEEFRGPDSEMWKLTIEVE
jgi:hypothetical protein